MSPWLWVAYILGGYLGAIAISALFHIVVEALFAKEPKYKGSHVLISGASEGLGLCVAKRMVEKGAHVTIMSRNVAKLKKAIAELQECRPKDIPEDNQEIKYISGDVTKPEDCARAVAGGPALPDDQDSESAGAKREVDFLICCAGAADPGYFLEQDISKYRWMMDVNYFGVLNLVKAVAPSMAARRSGHVVIVASAMSLMNYAGYSQYAPSKWAARALADGLRNELKPHNIKVSAYYPANIDSPGFERENRNKPIECKEIEGEASLCTPMSAADTLLSGLKRHQYAITNDPIIWLARIAMNGVTPRHYFVTEVLLYPIISLVLAGYVAYMDHVAKKGPGCTGAAVDEKKES